MEVVALLERFRANPIQTRHDLQMKLGLWDERAADLFALTVFLCDDLLQLKPELSTTTTDNNNYHAAASAAATRFYVIASKLPMDLQMILCRRAVVSMKQIFYMKIQKQRSKPLSRFFQLPPLQHQSLSQKPLILLPGASSA